LVDGKTYLPDGSRVQEGTIVLAGGKYWEMQNGSGVISSKPSSDFIAANQEYILRSPYVQIFTTGIFAQYASEAVLDNTLTNAVILDYIAEREGFTYDIVRHGLFDL
jgi:hypothetical protein